MKKIRLYFVFVLVITLSWHCAFRERKITADDWFQKGVQYEKQDIYAKAISMYTNAIKLDRRHADAYFRRGKIYFAMRPSECMIAIRDFNEVIVIEPDNVEAYYERGLLHAYMMNNEQAQADMETASSLGHKKAKEWLNPALRKKRTQYFHLGNYLPSKSDPIVLFDFNRSEIKLPYYSLLDEIGTVLKETLPDIKIVVAGYCDSIGAEKYNEGLSERRAEAVSNYLSKKYSIAPDRIIIKAYGEGGAIASNETEGGRAQNRRVEMLGIKGPEKG
jgi:outer membrane protein OmpA-like peptidoglycan-associated protein